MKNLISSKVSAKIFLVLVLLSFSLSNFVSGTILAADKQDNRVKPAPTSCVVQPGAGTDYSLWKYFQKAYGGQGGQTNMGCAINGVHWWEGLLVQDFAGGSYDRPAIFYDVNKKGNSKENKAYVLWGPILGRYWSNSQWGPPLTDVWSAGKSPQGTTGQGVDFNGMQVYSHYAPEKMGNIVAVVRGVTLDKYNGLKPQGTMSGLGFPMADGMQLRGSTQITGVWYQQFEGGAIYTYFKNSKWEADAFPDFKLPWDPKDNGTIKWTSGPHSWSTGGHLTTTISASRGSGLDFAKDGGVSFDVFSMASGKVIMNKCGFSGLGCIVAMKHDLDGSVMIYAHLQQDGDKPKNSWPMIDEKIGPLVWIDQHVLIGHAGQSGGQAAVHLHIEFRDGAKTCEAPVDNAKLFPKGDCGDIGFAGNPVGWDGKVLVDGYFILGYFDSAHGCYPDLVLPKDCIFNYDGSAVRASLAFPYYFFPYKDNGIPRTVLAYVDPNFACNSTTNCEINTKETVFADHGLFTGGGGIMYSTNGSSGNSTPPSTCPSDGRPGIYSYADKNYKGACFFSKTDISNYGNTSVGDNKLSSINILCKCQVKLYENKNFGGRYDILNKSDSNLDIRSLGGRYSSAKITNKDKTPTSTPSVTPSATATPTRTSTLTPSKTPTATATNTYTPTPSDTPTSAPTSTNTSTPVSTDTSTPSPTLEPTPTETPVPSETPTALPTDTPTATSTSTFTSTPTQTPFNTGWLELLQNGGFETCNNNISGWSIGAGAFDVTTNNPRSGRCAIQRSHDANPAWFYQYADVSQYRSWIDAGYGTADFEGWFQIGDGEQMRVIVRFYQGSVVRNEFLVDWTSVGRGQGWVRKGFPTSMVIPTGTDRIYIEIGHKRDSGTNNDVDTDDVSLKVQFASP